MSAAPIVQSQAPADTSAEPDVSPAETLAEMAALAPEPAAVEPHRESVEQAAHVQEAGFEAVSDVATAAFDTAHEIAGDAATVASSALSTNKDEAPVALPTLTVPTLVGTVTAPSVPRITAMQFGAEAFGSTVMSYFAHEGEAFAAHMRALAGAKSMAEFVRLQIEEFQRAADATLTCWGRLTVSASRTAIAR